MKYIKLTAENLESEHICCAISNNRDIQVSSKKAWLRDRLDEGLVFLKGDARGKCFIEYIPAEYAWAPIDADGYTYIDCLWVSGQFKGHGYSSDLLDRCISDSISSGRQGICVLSSKKKTGFLSDPKYLAYKGFRISDRAEPYFELWYLPHAEGAVPPKFNSCVKERHDMPSGFTLYYTNQCPFTAKYVPLLCEAAESHGVPMTVVRIDSLAAAKNAPCPFTTFALFRDGKFLTHEIQSVPKFEKIISEA